MSTFRPTLFPICLLVLVALAGCSREEPFRVLAILPLSGDYALIGQDVERGLLFAVDELNARDGLHGRPVELVFRDCRSKVPTAQQQFTNALAGKRPDILFTATDPIAKALSVCAEGAGVPLIGLVVADPDFTRQRHWTFRNSSTHDEELKPVVQLLSGAGIGHVGLLHVDCAWGRALDAGFAAMLARQQPPLRHVGLPFDGALTNFRDLVASAVDLPALLLAGSFQHIRDLLLELRRTRYPGMILTTSLGASPEIRNLPEADGIYCPTSILNNPRFTLPRRIVDSFYNRFQRELTLLSATAYDALSLLPKTLDKTALHAAGIRSALESESILPSLFGTRYSGAGNHDFVPRLYPARISKTEIEFLAD